VRNDDWACPEGEFIELGELKNLGGFFSCNGGIICICVYSSSYYFCHISMKEQKDNITPYYHGTKADLQPGDLIMPGFTSNFGKRKQALWVYLTATVDAATWGAELAIGEGRGRIYIVEPTGPIEDDPT